jgi:membrane protease YdiL (CAAX protease family)
MMVLYTYLTSLLVSQKLIDRLPLLPSLPGDLPLYGFRFLASFLLLGVFPLAVSLLLGENLTGLGFRAPARRLPAQLEALVLIVCVLIGAVGAYSPQLYAYYPYSSTLLEIISDRGLFFFLPHAFLYLALYYLPWEFFFRGIMVFPLLRLAESQGIEKMQFLLLLASLQAIPSTLLHFGHPFVETLGALPFGFVAGYLALKTGSILPVLVIHSLIGISQDFFIAMRVMEVLP